MRTIRCLSLVSQSRSALLNPTSFRAKMTSRSNASNLYLRGDIDFDRDHPISDGGFGELFAGSHPSDGKVALKRLRIRGTGDERQGYLVDTMTEAHVWRGLVHPNVLPFLGILFEGRDVYLVSPLVENGSLPHYISNHSDADRVALLKEVAEGLAYLHGQGVIHGDVKGGNILVLPGPKAALCDFGLSKILSPSSTTTVGGLGTIRWESPELMEGGARSYEADTYAYGMTIYEIISGKIPFHNIQKDTAVIIAVLSRDERPATDVLNDLHENLRDIAERCWAKLPENRPPMTKVSQLLSPPPPPTISLQASSLIRPEENQPVQLSDGDEARQNRGRNHTIAHPVAVATLKGHTSYVKSVAFSPDGSRLASGSGEWTVKLWNIASGAIEVTLRGHAGWINSVAFSPDGSRVVSGSFDKTVRLWDTMSGVEVATLQGHTGDVEAVAFSPDGSRVASGSDDETVRLWNAISGAEIAIFRGHANWVMSVTFSPDGSKLASGSADGNVQLWDATSGVKLMTLQHTHPVTSIVFSSDGMQLASGSRDHTVRVWNTMSGVEIMTLRGHTSDVLSIAVSPDGTQIASGAEDTTVRLWDMTSGAEIATLKGHTDYVRSVAFSPDGTLLASGSFDDTIRIWKLI